VAPHEERDETTMLPQPWWPSICSVICHWTFKVWRALWYVLGSFPS